MKYPRPCGTMSPASCSSLNARDRCELVMFSREANLLRGNLLRKEDMAGRLGGEEFAVLLPNTTVEQGHAIAERLRIALEQSTIASDDGQTIRVTMSVGLCPVLPDSASTLASSDAALYQAKNTGRNRVVRAGTPEA